MWGKEVPFSCTPIEDNLRTVFTARPVETKGDKPEYGDGMLVHWRMDFTAGADMGKCVLMQAERPLK